LRLNQNTAILAPWQETTELMVTLFFSNTGLQVVIFWNTTGYLV